MQVRQYIKDILQYQYFDLLHTILVFVHEVQIMCLVITFQAFRHSYSFLSHIRAEEKKELEEEMKTQNDSRRKEKIKYLLQRMVMYKLKMSTKHMDFVNKLLFM
jgi:hypothetical protein